MERKEQEYALQEGLAAELAGGLIDRRQFMTTMMTAGLGLAGASVLSACSPADSGGAGATASPTGDGAGGDSTSTRPLTPAFYQWVEDFHPDGIKRVNEGFDDLNYQIAPTENFDMQRFIAEAQNNESTWDVYVGMTPFVEMTAFIEAGVIEPWDPYIPKDVLDDISPAIREECSIDGKLYNWPFLLDVNVMGYNSRITEEAGIGDVPQDWDAYLAAAQEVIDSGAAQYGATYDGLGWRSIGPFAHSLSSDVYTPEGLFDFTSDIAAEALELMKKIMAVSHPDILAGANADGVLPDEVAFAAESVAYYTKFQNAILRMAGNWPEPSNLKLVGLPSFAGGEGSTIFWTTGASLFKHGQNKEAAAEYIRTLTYDNQLWQDSVVGSATTHPGQLPPYESILSEWDSNPPEWLPDFVPLVRDQMTRAKAIENHLFGLTQFIIGREHWEKYLTGDVSSPQEALQQAQDAVNAELEKA
ncbi:MAG TPA: extracellular solute-binding protein [Egibacteraceae bacterium]|nr:extracellular solute-binding protein [Egibacteraceae bacterium]